MFLKMCRNCSLKLLTVCASCVQVLKQCASLKQLCRYLQPRSLTPKLKLKSCMIMCAVCDNDLILLFKKTTKL